MGVVEGGINVVFCEGDLWEDYVYDMMKGLDYLVDVLVVEIFCKDSLKEIIKFEYWGMVFFCDDDGCVSQWLFGGFLFLWIIYVGVEMGYQLFYMMYEQFVKCGIKVYDEWYVI